MNDTIVNNINNVVGENDVLYHLGDWSFGSAKTVGDFRDRINCKEIHLILGNHDREFTKNIEVHSHFSSVSYYRELWLEDIQTKVILSHYPMKSWNGSMYGNWMLYGHTHGNLENYIHPRILKKLLDEGRHDDIKLLSENKKVEGVSPNGTSLEIGIDCHPEFRPFSLSEVKEYMDSNKKLSLIYRV
jgi:calcineurin-like phosphoesterase family protein|tara:strand:- start:1291 stop:1851 length:561 start_codon:yes stop_codon:yes gene_type:complete